MAAGATANERGGTRRRVAAGLAVAAALLLPGTALAVEREWHVGLDGGYAAADFREGSASGFATGVHGTYGVSDAFNLRMHVDVSAFDLPLPRTSAVLTNVGFGGEYVFDILQWVPYIGLTVGPNVMTQQGGRTIGHLGFEVPLGLDFRLNRSWTIGAEARYRLLVLGDASESPMSSFLGLARAQYAWGW